MTDNPNEAPEAPVETPNPNPTDGTGAPIETPSTPSEAAPTAEEAAAAAALATARAVVPEKADGYQVNVSDRLKPLLGEAQDPAMAALRDFALKNGKDQGFFDDVLGVMDHMAGQGLFAEQFDPAAELAKLGDGGAARQQEVELFADSLKARGELTDEEHGVLVSLAPEAAGVTLFEKLRKMMGPNGLRVEAPAGAEATAEAAQAEAQALRRDPKYETDREFRKKADEAWMAAFSGPKA